MVDILQKNQLVWLTVPRLAVVVVPVSLAVVFSAAGLGYFAVGLFILSSVGLGRLVWFKLLPYEARQLNQAQKALAKARPDEALWILQSPLRCSGKYFWLLRTVLLSKAYVREGSFIEAHDALNKVDEKHLLPNEIVRLRYAWAQLFLSAGNTGEATRRLENIAIDSTDDPEYLLIKACIQIEVGDWVGARKLLESALDKNPKDELRILLLNNLANVALFQERTEEQLRHLQAALCLFRSTPRSDLTSILHHNLAIALVRAGQTDAAREVLREAWAAGDDKNIHHVLEVLNNSLHAAREAGDKVWKHEIYEEFDRQLARFDRLSSREQLALDVSALRMRRNDNVPTDAGSYAPLINRLLDALNNGQTVIPERDCIAALSEICHDLKREIESGLAASVLPVLLELLRRASLQLVHKRVFVEAQLTALSPRLIGPLETWYRYQSSIDKADIFLATDSRAEFLQAFERLFRHLREKAERFTEQDLPLQAVESWVILCDEYLAYHDQLPFDDRLDWSNRYRQLADDALNNAMALVDSSKNQRRHVHQMIGLAYFLLRLREDRAAATRYISVVRKINPAMDHSASWLRDRYTWVRKHIDVEVKGHGHFGA